MKDNILTMFCCLVIMVSILKDAKCHSNAAHIHIAFLYIILQCDSGGNNSGGLGHFKFPLKAQVPYTVYLLRLLWSSRPQPLDRIAKTVNKTSACASAHIKLLVM